MNPTLTLFIWETRRLLRTPAAWIALGSLLIAGLFALGSGAAKISRQEKEIGQLAAQHAAGLQRLAGHFHDGTHAGEIAYYTFFPSHQPLTDLARFSIGLRDVAPSAVWVRLLGIEAQLYEAGIGNPTLQALGHFDLAFLVCALAPLVLLMLAHDLLTREQQQGILTLVSAQARWPHRLFLVRLLVRALAVGAVCTALFAVGCATLRVSLDPAAWGWLADLWLYLAWWTAAAGLIAVACRSVSASLTAAATTWIATVVLLPAIFNLAVVAAYPVSEGLELTVRQRQEVHAGWDKPKEQTFARFFPGRPEWKDTAPVTTRFAYKWYYAMHEVGDLSVAREATAYRERLLARQAAIERLAWLAPPAFGQILFSRRAQTDLDAHLDHLAHVRAFHERLKGFFYPLVFAEQNLKPADFSRLPSFVPAVREAHSSTGGRLPLFAGIVVLAAFTRRKLHARFGAARA